MDMREAGVPAISAPPGRGGRTCSAAEPGGGSSRDLRPTTRFTPSNIDDDGRLPKRNADGIPVSRTGAGVGLRLFRTGDRHEPPERVAGVRAARSAGVAGGTPEHGATAPDL